ALDRRHRFTMAMLYDVPFFQHHSNWAVKNVIGNWEIAPVYTYQTGEWATVESNRDANLNGDAAGDRVIFNKSGIANTVSDVSPLCRSAVPSADCTMGLVNCKGTEKLTVPTSPCPLGVNVVGNVVGYAALNSTAQYLRAGPGTLANVGRNTLLTRPINNFDV